MGYSTLQHAIAQNGVGIDTPYLISMFRFPMKAFCFYRLTPATLLLTLELSLWGKAKEKCGTWVAREAVHILVSKFGIQPQE